MRTGTGEIFRYWTLNVTPKRLQPLSGEEGGFNATEIALKESEAFDVMENECGGIDNTGNMAASIGTS